MNEENNKIVLDLNLFKIILDQEAKKLVGRVCKRFEISDDKEVIKRESKELIYETFRDIFDTLTTGKFLFEIQSKDIKKGD
jgi:hypothetical protein